MSVHVCGSEYTECTHECAYVYVGLSVCVYTRECAYMGVCGSSDHTHRSVCVFVCVPVSVNVHTYEHVGLSM